MQYNGCTWKGGKLRLEKAKEHYLAQLKREWAEDAMLSNPANQNEEKSSDGPRKSESFNMDSLKLNIFFPKLKKVSSSQLIGTVIVNTFLTVCYTIFCLNVVNAKILSNDPMKRISHWANQLQCVSCCFFTCLHFVVFIIL